MLRECLSCVSIGKDAVGRKLHESVAQNVALEYYEDVAAKSNETTRKHGTVKHYDNLTVQSNENVARKRQRRNNFKIVKNIIVMMLAGN